MLVECVFAGVSILLGFLLQTTVLPMIPFLSSVPNLLLIVTMTFAILKGRREGMAVGLISGLLLDVAGGGIIGFYGLIYLYIGYLNGLLKRFLTEDLILIPMGLCIMDEILYGIYVFVFHYLVRGKLDFASYLSRSMMPELVITLIFTIFVYGILMYISHEPTTRRRRKRDIKFV